MKVLLSEERIIQHIPFVCEFKIKNVTETKKKFEPRKKTWKLEEGNKNYLCEIVEWQKCVKPYC